jgi:hypothetical protein
MDLVEELARLIRKFESENIEYALCGGLAMAIYAFPRATLDIDVMIEPDKLEQAKKSVGELGFSIDAGLSEFKGGSIRIHRMTKVVPESADHLVLDMVLVTPEIRAAWETRKKIAWEKGELSVVSPKGLIELKSIRGSGQDEDDIRHLRSIIGED